MLTCSSIFVEFARMRYFDILCLKEAMKTVDVSGPSPLELNQVGPPGFCFLFLHLFIFC